MILTVTFDEHDDPGEFQTVVAFEKFQQMTGFQMLMASETFEVILEVREIEIYFEAGEVLKEWQLRSLVTYLYTN